jgi:hypothetical protein
VAESFWWPGRSWPPAASTRLSSGDERGTVVTSGRSRYRQVRPHPCRMILANPGLVILDAVDPCDRRSFAGRRVAVPLEPLSSHAAEHVIGPVVDVLDSVPIGAGTLLDCVTMNDLAQPAAHRRGHGRSGTDRPPLPGTPRVTSWNDSAHSKPTPSTCTTDRCIGVVTDGGALHRADTQVLTRTASLRASGLRWSLLGMPSHASPRRAGAQTFPRSSR